MNGDNQRSAQNIADLERQIGVLNVQLNAERQRNQQLAGQSNSNAQQAQ